MATRREIRRSVGQYRWRGKKLLELYGTATSATTTTVDLAELGPYPAQSTLFTMYGLSVVGGTGSGIDRVVTLFTKANDRLTFSPSYSTLDTTSVVELWQPGLNATLINNIIDQAIDLVMEEAFQEWSTEKLAYQAGRERYPLPGGAKYLTQVFYQDASPSVAYGSSHLNGWLVMGVDETNERVGQRWHSSANQLIGGVALMVRKVGSPTDNLSVVLERDYNGYPTYTPPAPTIFSDDFTDTSGTSLANHSTGYLNNLWTKSVGSATMSISGNKAVLDNALSEANLFYTIEAGTTEVVVEADITSPSNDPTWLAGIIAGYADTSNYVFARLLHTASGDQELELGDGTGVLVHNQIGAAALTAGTTWRLRLEISGSTIRAWMGDAATVKDEASSLPNGWLTSTTTNTLGTRAGIAAWDATNKLPSWDNFRVYPSNINATSDTISGSDISQEGTLYFFKFSSPVQVREGEDYHLYIKRSGAVSDENYYLIGCDLSGSYSEGEAEVWDSRRSVSDTTNLYAPYWTHLSSDLIFAVVPHTGTWNELLGHEWDVETGSQTHLAILRSKGQWLPTTAGSYPSIPEGVPLRVLGLQRAARPTSDTAELDIPRAYLEAKVLALLLSQLDSSLAQQAAYFDQVAMRELHQHPVRTRLPVNARAVFIAGS